MKKRIQLFFLLLLSGLAFNAIGQTSVTPDPRLYDIYSQTEIQSLTTRSPGEIEYLNFLLNKSWFILPIEAHKLPTYNIYPYLYGVDRTTKIIKSTFLTDSDLPNFNLLKYNYTIKPTRNYYRIPNTNKMLVIYAQYELTKKFNEYRGITE